MPAKRNNTSVLLQKANSQLRGERISVKPKDEDELAVYLNNLVQKTQQNKNVNFEEFGDASISSEAEAKNSGSLNEHNYLNPVAQISVPASRFLKKKPSLEAVASTNLEQEKIETSRKSKNKTKVKADAKAGKKSRRLQLLSKDSESEFSNKGSDVDWRSDSAEPGGHRKDHKLPKKQKSLAEKNQTNLKPSRSPILNRSLSQEKRFQQKNGGKHKDEIVRTLGSQFVSSDQDSLAEFIQGLSMSESSARRPRNLVTKKQQKWRKKTASVSNSPSPVHGSRSPSPFKRSKSPFERLSRSGSQDTEMADNMNSEMMESRQDSENSDVPFKVKLMDASSLLHSSSPPPSHKNRKTQEKRPKNQFHNQYKSSKPNITTPPMEDTSRNRLKSSKISSKKSDSSSNRFDAFGVHMADELLNFNDKEAEQDISEMSEIKTESSGRERKAKWDQYETGKTGNVDDAQRKISLFDRSSPETSFSEVITVDRFTDRRSNEADVTDVEYSDSFNSESKTMTPSKSLKSKSSKSKSALKSMNDSKSRIRRDQKKVVLEEMLLDVSVADAEGNRHNWNTTQMGVRVSTPYGLQYVDPAPIATHVVSADALEALTAYSPNMLALQEMMRAQLQLIQNFMDIQHRIYNSCLDGLNDNYKYTTLEDTKEFIKKNRKSRMASKETLQLVDVEEEPYTA